MTFEDFCNICLLVFVLITGVFTTGGVLLLYVMAMFFNNERD